jgi:hypothetical protein
MDAWNQHVMPVVDQLEVAVRGLLPSDSVAAFDKWLADTQHPLSKDLPLMNPFHVVLIILGYFLSVFVGKALMSGVGKFELKGFSKLHNAFLIVLSGYMCFGAIKGAIDHKFNLWGNGINNDQVEVR